MKVSPEQMASLQAEYGDRGFCEDLVNAVAAMAPKPQVELTVVLWSFPESNGKRNWTAMFKRKEKWDGLVGNAGGITIDRGECWQRVAYHAEQARFLLGERSTEPCILAYGKDVNTPEEWTGVDPEANPAFREAR